MTTLEKNDTSVVIDARGPRFSAAITVFVLAIALVTQSLTLIAFQLIVFLIGALKDHNSHLTHFSLRDL